MKLNLGCGMPKFHLKGWVNCDVNPECKPDLCFNVADQEWKPFNLRSECGERFGNGTKDEIRADNLLEHLDNDGFLNCMNEAHRVLKPEGAFWIKVPDALNWPEGQIGDPTHKRAFCWPRSFYYLREDCQQWKNYGSTYGFLPWRLVEGGTDKRFITVVLRPVK